MGVEHQPSSAWWAAICPPGAKKISKQNYSFLLSSERASCYPITPMILSLPFKTVETSLVSNLIFSSLQSSPLLALNVCRRLSMHFLLHSLVLLVYPSPTPALCLLLQKCSRTEPPLSCMVLLGFGLQPGVDHRHGGVSPLLQLKQAIAKIGWVLACRNSL